MPPRPSPAADRDRMLTALAATQSGCFSSSQLYELGFSRNTVRSRVDSGRWERHAKGVYGFSDWPVDADVDSDDNWTRRVWLADLHAKGTGTTFRRSAGRWMGMHPIDGRRSTVELMAPLSAGRALEGTIRYRSDSLAPQDRIVVRGLTVTSPARTIVDIAAVAMSVRLRLLIDNSISEGLLTRAELDDALLRGAISGRRGALRLSKVLDDMSPGVVTNRSELERRLVRAVELSGLPEPVWEYPLPNAIGWRGFVDCCWPEVKFIVEADSRTWHDTVLQAPKDQERDAEAGRVGFHTLRRRYRDLTSGIEATAQLLRETYEQRARLFLG